MGKGGFFGRLFFCFSVDKIFLCVYNYTDYCIIILIMSEQDRKGRAYAGRLYIGILLVYFAVMIFIGVKNSRSSRSVQGFVLGGRSVGPWLTAFAYGTSYFSAVIFIGYAGQFGWNFGIAATWIGIGNALIGSLLAWAVLGSEPG